MGNLLSVLPAFVRKRGRTSRTWELSFAPQPSNNFSANEFGSVGSMMIDLFWPVLGARATSSCPWWLPNFHCVDIVIHARLCR